MNYYAIAALILLWLTILLGLDFGGMRSQERRAVRGDGLFNENERHPVQLTDDMPSHEPGAMRALILPFAVLIVGVVAGMYISGGIIGSAWDVLTTLAEADVAIALNVGGIAALIIAAYYCIHYTKGNPFTPRTKRRGAVRGAQSMLPAILILLSAWVLADLISVLGT